MPGIVLILVPLVIALLRSYPALRDTAEELGAFFAQLRAEDRDATPEEVDRWLARAEAAAARLQTLRELAGSKIAGGQGGPPEAA